MNKPYKDTTIRALANLDTIIAHKQLIADRVRLHAGNFVGIARRRMLQLGRFFDETSQASDLLGFAEALTVSSCILDAQGKLVVSGENAAEKNCDDAASCAPLALQAIDDGIRNASVQFVGLTQSNRVKRLLLFYPLALLFSCAVLMLFYSYFVIPEFDRMFDEFGLALPVSTKLTLGIAGLARRFGIWILIGVGAAFAYRVFVSYCPSRRPKDSSFLLPRKWFESERAKWARWSIHVSTLLGSGIDREDAISIAGESSQSPELSVVYQDWLKQLQRGSNPFANNLVVPGNLSAPVGYALGLSQVGDQAAVLRDVAISYSELERSRRSWWLTWFSPLTICILGVAAWMMYASLFMPLLSLISGLT